MSLFSFLGFDFALAKDLKISEVSRFSVDCLMDEAVVPLPAELGLDESSFFHVAGGWDVLSVAAASVGCLVSSLPGVIFAIGASDMGGLLPVLLLTLGFCMTP